MGSHVGRWSASKGLLAVAAACVVALALSLMVSVGFSAVPSAYAGDETSLHAASPANQGTVLETQASGSSSSYTYVGGIAPYNKAKIGKATYQSELTGNHCRIVRVLNGEKKVLATKASSAFLTNGRYLFYSKYQYRITAFESKYALYRIDLKTGAERKLATGTDIVARQCKGNYLYYGRDVVAEGVRLKALNLKTLKKTHMANQVGGVTVKNGRVVTIGNYGSITNVPIYSFKTNGKGKVKIDTGVDVVVKGKKIYYTKFKFDKNYRLKYKTYRCSFTGKGKKAVTGWRSSIPKKYRSR